MLAKLAARNVAAASCQAKIFGGGDMFPSRRTRADFAVGRLNGEAPGQIWSSVADVHGIPLVADCR